MISKSDPDKVQDRWDASAKDKVENRPRKFAKHSDVIRKTLNELYCDGAGDLATDVKNTYFKGVKIGNALELGGGIGDFACHVMNTLPIKNMTVYDLSAYSVGVGNKRAGEQNLPIQFEQVDLNEVKLKSGHYDLIFASNSIHHVENLENLFTQVNRALTPDGLFFCIDYMGPDYMQWTDSQLDIINRILAVFPDEFARNSLKEDVIDKTIQRIPLSCFQKSDPSEGCRASEIIGIIKENLEILELRPLGETLLYELLRGRIHNFDDKDEKDSFILKLLTVFEHILIDYKILGSDFNFVAARKARTKLV